MSRKLPTKLWALESRFGALTPTIVMDRTGAWPRAWARDTGLRIGRVTIAWEPKKPAKKARRK